MDSHRQIEYLVPQRNLALNDSRGIEFIPNMQLDFGKSLGLGNGPLQHQLRVLEHLAFGFQQHLDLTTLSVSTLRTKSIAQVSKYFFQSAQSKVAALHPAFSQRRWKEVLSSNLYPNSRELLVRSLRVMSKAVQTPKVILLCVMRVRCIHFHLNPPSFATFTLLSESQAAERCLAPTAKEDCTKSLLVLKLPQKFQFLLLMVVRPLSQCNRIYPFEVTLVQRLLSFCTLNHSFTSSEMRWSALRFCLKEAAPKRPLKFTFKVASFSCTKSSVKMEQDWAGQSFHSAFFIDQGFLTSGSRVTFRTSNKGTADGLCTGFAGKVFALVVVIFNLFNINQDPKLRPEINLHLYSSYFHIRHLISFLSSFHFTLFHPRPLQVLNAHCTTLCIFTFGNQFVHNTMRIKLKTIDTPKLLWTQSPCTVRNSFHNPVIERTPRFQRDSIYFHDQVNKAKKVFTQFQKPQLLLLNFRRQILEATSRIKASEPRFNTKEQNKRYTVATNNRLYSIPPTSEYKYDRNGMRSQVVTARSVKASPNSTTSNFYSSQRLDLSKPLNFYPGPGSYFPPNAEQPLPLSPKPSKSKHY